VPSLCGHQIANATFVVRETARAWKLTNPSGTVSCPIPHVANRIAAALNIPC
jgi:hypothetical protein